MFQNVSLILYRILHHEFDLFFSDMPMNKNVVVMTCKHRDKMLQVNVPVLHQWHVQTADVQWSVLPSRCVLPPRLWWYTLNPDMSRQTQEVKNSSRKTKKLPRNKSKSVAFLFLFINISESVLSGFTSGEQRSFLKITYRRHRG